MLVIDIVTCYLGDANKIGPYLTSTLVLIYLYVTPSKTNHYMSFSNQ